MARTYSKGHARTVDDTVTHAAIGAESKSVDCRVQCRAKVPVFIYILVIPLYIGFGGLILFIMEAVPLLDGIYLIVNILLTLGFATLLPGMNGESDGIYRNTTSQLSLIVLAFYVIGGMTLLTSSFTVMAGYTRTTEASAVVESTARRPALSSYTPADRRMLS